MYAQTLQEMLTDRGYTGVPLLHSTTFVNPDTLVAIYADTKLGISNVKEITQLLEDNTDAKRCIVVYKGNITPYAKSALNALEQSIETFSTSELNYNVTRHTLVPKHELMDNTFKTELCSQLRISEKKLPVMHKTDPVARYYGANVGQLFKITRIGFDGRQSPYFRIVVP